MADGRPDGDGPAVVRWVSAFGRFWWDFLVGDTPELFVGVVAVLGVVAGLCLRPGLRTTAALLTPLLVAAVLAASVRRAVRRRDP